MPDSKETKRSRKLAVIDGSSYIFRAFYAIRGLANSSGFPTGAVFGFHNMLKKVIDDIKPDLLLVAFDAKGPTFRHERYPLYKANRKETPEDLIPQIPKIKELVSAYNIKSIEAPGYEADDIIGTVAAKAPEDVEVVIVTGDKDMAQLVSEKVTLLDTMKGEVTDLAAVREKYGTTGAGLLQVFGLSGDTSDNIPGVSGIGEKTAVDLIKKYGTLEEIFKSIDDFKGKRRENLEKNEENALLSRELFALDLDVPIDFNLEEMEMETANSEKLKEIFTELEFHTLLKDLEGSGDVIEIPHETVFDEGRLLEIIEGAKVAEYLSVDTETTSVFPMEARLVGVSLCFEEDSAFYIPLGHRYLGAPAQVDMKRCLDLLRDLLSEAKVVKIGQNIKYDYIVLKRNGVTISPIAFDTMVASYLINPSRRGHGLDNISLRYLGHKPISYKDVAGSGKNQLTFDEVMVEEAAPYAAEDAYLVYKMLPIMEKKMEELETQALFHEVEIPLIEVLAEMEIKGVMVDEARLHVLSAEFSGKIEELRVKIIDHAGEDFNINSPKQLGEVLFERMKLPSIKKTKTGYSTDNDVLTALSLEHPIAGEILEYRSLTKLKSTYVDSLVKLINRETGRIHTSFNQTVTATGRLSSSDPNLQNIPIRTPEGRKIREAFIPEEGHLFISSDYSQIELRLFAHLSQDPALLDAFSRDEDIHSSTAGAIFGIDAADVTPEMRRKAKTINFGIIYGISAHGLSQQLNIGRQEAQEFIDSYFDKFSGVKEFIDSAAKKAEEDGYVTTIMDRRRYLPELKSKDRNVRAFAQRMAVNTHVQGSAADLIKLAMINIHRRLKKENMDAAMIIQVHDELLLETPQNDVENVVKIVGEEMEGVMDLSVALKVDINTGKNWSEVH